MCFQKSSDASSKKACSPAYFIDVFKLSERVASKLAGISRTGFRYCQKGKVDDFVRSRLKELASQCPRYGYLMRHGFLKGEGLVVNRKHIYRLYTEEALLVRTKKRKNLTRPKQPIEVPSAPNQRWSMDFVSDQLSSGRWFRVLNVVDDFSREMVGQLISVSISGRQVTRFLSRLVDQRGKPKKISCDNGTEFTSKAMFFWSKETGVELGFIQPDKSTGNAFVESLNVKFRNECLNQHWSRILDEARYEIDQWREHYNNVRPHSSLNYLPPVEYTKRVA